MLWGGIQQLFLGQIYFASHHPSFSHNYFYTETAGLSTHFLGLSLKGQTPSSHGAKASEAQVWAL